MLRIYFIISIMVSLLMVSAIPGAHAQWQTSEPRYSYEDFRDLRIAAESQRERDNAHVETSLHSERNVKGKRITKGVPDKKPSTVKKKKNIKKADIKFKKYTVKKGDTLFKIAQKFNTTDREICKVNSLKNKNRIFAGMSLKIPVNSKGKASSPSAAGAVTGKAPRFTWPLKRVVSYKRDGEKGIRSIGIIIKSKSNEPVFPAASGIVKKVGEMRGFGKYVVVTHKDRYMTVYSNLKNISVTEGDRVRVNSNIGTVSDDNLLHFQIDHAGKPRNPLNFLPKKG